MTRISKQTSATSLPDARIIAARLAIPRAPSRTDRIAAPHACVTTGTGVAAILLNGSGSASASRNRTPRAQHCCALARRANFIMRKRHVNKHTLRAIAARRAARLSACGIVAMHAAWRIAAASVKLARIGALSVA